MKFPWTFVAVLAINSLMAASNINGSPDGKEAVNTWSSNTEVMVKERLQQVPLPFEARVNGQVMGQIRRYVTTGYRDAELILGRAKFYFPIFEHYLRLYDLPEELKYLPIVESGLRPYVHSGAGAAGLWQMMYHTGRYYKLTINDYVDERMDPYRSTEAAVRMLADLHQQFGDWSLVLAAYNSGPGRVQKAMRYAGSKDYWTIREYLPVETQGYVPAFIAATYFANFYADHGLTPRISVNLPETVETVLVNQPLSFSKIAYASGVDMAQLVKLNPGYVKRALPGGDKAYYLMLPSEAVPAVKKLIRESGRKELEAPPGTFRTTYLVRSGMSIESLAELVNCSVKDIMNWNDLPAPEVMVGQQLVLFLSKEYALIRA